MGKSLKVISKDSEGNEKVIIVKKPTNMNLTEAQLHAAVIFNRAKETCTFRSQLDDVLREKGVWKEEHDKLSEELSNKIVAGLKLLQSKKHPNGQKVKLSEARETAIEIRRNRLAYNLLLAKKREYDAFTVEGQTENARFDFLVSVCTFTESGDRVFESLDDYYEKQEEPYAVEAASKLSTMTYNLEEDWEKKLPENEFLIKNKLVDDKLRYIDKDGNWVNAVNERVDEFGRKIDANGELIDKQEIVDETAEFEDDIFQPVK